MAFLTYLWDLLHTAFNPNNPVLMSTSLVTTVWGVLTGLLARTSKLRHLERLLHKISTGWRVFILVALILSCLIAAAYSIQSNCATLLSQLLQNRPSLIFHNYSIQLTTVDNNPTAIIDVSITNNGSKPAHNLHSRLFSAPQSNLQTILLQDIPIIQGPLNQGDTTILRLSFQRNGSDKWYIYHRLQYSDAANNGTQYTQEDWSLLDFSVGGLSHLNATDRQIFQTYIDKFLAP